MDAEADDVRADHPLHRWAAWGLVPLALLTLWLVAIDETHVWHAGTASLLSAYGAMMLSFLAGLRCGIDIGTDDPPSPRDLVLTLAPAALGWLALMMPAGVGFAVLAVAFAAQGAWDSLGVSSGRMPERLGGQRIRLTLLAVAAMIAAAAATA